MRAYYSNKVDEGALCVCVVVDGANNVRWLAGSDDDVAAAHTQQSAAIRKFPTRKLYCRGVVKRASRS